MGNRTSAEDRSNINKVYKPIASYFGNVAKESSQAAKAVVKDFLDADAAKNKPRFTDKGVSMGVKPKDNNAKAEFGQAVGSLLGKRYDSKGNRR